MEMKNIGNELMQMRVFLLFRQTSFLSPAGALETKEKSGRPLRYANEGKWDRGGEGEGSRGNLRAPLYLSPSARIGQTNGGRHVSGFHLGGGGGAGGAGAEAAPVDADRRRRLVVAAADQRQFGHHQLLLAAAKTKQKTPKKNKKKTRYGFAFLDALVMASAILLALSTKRLFYGRIILRFSILGSSLVWPWTPRFRRCTRRRRDAVLNSSSSWRRLSTHKFNRPLRGRGR